MSASGVGFPACKACGAATNGDGSCVQGGCRARYQSSKAIAPRAGGEFQAQTRLEVEVKRSKNTSRFVVLCIDGESYPMTDSDAMDLARLLMAASRNKPAGMEATKNERAIYGEEFVFAANKRTNRAIAWAEHVDGEVARKIFDETSRLGLNRPVTVYGKTCDVSGLGTLVFVQCDSVRP